MNNIHKQKSFQIKQSNLKTEFLCKVCDRSILENETEYHKYLGTLHKKNDINLYEKYTINNIKLDEFNKLLNVYITNHNKKIDVYFIHCDFKKESDNTSITQSIETDCVHNMESKRIKSQ